MKFKMALAFLLICASPANAERNPFFNPDVSIEYGAIKYTGTDAQVLSKADGAHAYIESISKKSKDNGFLHTALLKEFGRTTRAIEFYRPDQGGMKSSMSTFDSQKQIENITQCDSWSGCVTVTKEICNSAMDVFRQSASGPHGSYSGVTGDELKRCNAIIGDILSNRKFDSKEYVALAEKNYSEMYAYFGKHINKNAPSNFQQWVGKLPQSDKAAISQHDLKTNQNEQLAKVWTNGNVILGISRIYSVCEAKGHLLGATIPERGRTTDSQPVRR